jgi:hypothetical protein
MAPTRPVGIVACELDRTEAALYAKSQEVGAFEVVGRVDTHHESPRFCRSRLRAVRVGRGDWGKAGSWPVMAPIHGADDLQTAVLRGGPRG